MQATDISGMTIASAAAAIRERALSPVELAESYLSRIQRLNPSINAFISVTADRALADAHRAADEIAGGGYRGPLHGIPLALKDLFDTAGIRTSGGAKFLSDRVPERDSTAARRLREAGSVLLGKLNTHELAYGVTTNNPHFGPTHNPWNLDVIPGGSSGGSGAAIAAGMATATLGTDTGGSIRIPASLCGVVGLKPTYGRVSKAGVLPLSYQFDHPGPITRTVEDAALLLQVIAGYDPADASTVPVPVGDYSGHLRDGVKGLRVGVPSDYFFDQVDPEVQAAVMQAVETLRGLGAEVRQVSTPNIPALVGSLFEFVLAEAQEIHATPWKERPREFGADVAAILGQPSPPAERMASALRVRYTVAEQMRQLLEEVDVLITPTTPVTATRIGQDVVRIGDEDVPVIQAMIRLTAPFNGTHLPALSVPCGFSAAGLPIGLQISGRPFDEATVLRVGQAYEQASDWHLRRPRDLD